MQITHDLAKVSYCISFHLYQNIANSKITSTVKSHTISTKNTNIDTSVLNSSFMIFTLSIEYVHIIILLWKYSQKYFKQYFSNLGYSEQYSSSTWLFNSKHKLIYKTKQTESHSACKRV